VKFSNEHEAADRTVKIAYVCGPSCIQKARRRTWRESLDQFVVERKFATLQAAGRGGSRRFGGAAARSRPWAWQEEPTQRVYCLRVFRPWGLEAV